ncbi:MAG: glycoside hydrolase family 9 protein [Opitutaceae bacterium]|nr:glycoside hydrolase family 9 protein [Opitutaceae bacterium]
MARALVFVFLVFAAGIACSAVPAAVAESLLRVPAPGEHALRVVAPSVLELTYVTAPDGRASPMRPPQPAAAEFEVFAGGRRVTVSEVGVRRRVAYAPLKQRDLRVTNAVYLVLADPIAMGEKPVAVEVRQPKSRLWPEGTVFRATLAPLQWNPAIHVNEEGYAPGLPKLAMVGYYLGDLGELPVPGDARFELIDAGTGKTVHEGKLKRRRETGFNYTPAPYQQVWEADFSSFKDQGEFRLVVPGFGASLPFRIDDGMMMNFTRAYALGLYHQRCGGANELPFTRFTHAPCHVAPADVPVPAARFAKAWDIIANLNDKKPDHPSPWLRDDRSQLYPFVRTGKIDVSGGHHDAGDYSKYTINSAALVHPLMLAVDGFPGVADLDNLGLPESGDGIPDVLQEAKYEADFLAKLQDTDGGFYFLVYPKERRYESGTPPDKGDPQIVWPKNTASTAAAVAALAQCASSPVFQRHYPKEAKKYLEQAQLGWKFLTAAIEKHGQAGAYQKLTHYGHDFTHDDELAWAAAELFLATGDRAFEEKLFRWLNPADPEKRHWGWVRASFCYGNAIRSYAFAVRSQRLPANKVDAGYLAKCEAELRAAGDDALRWSRQSAYGTSFPEATKRQRRGGWFFASDRAFDATVAYQISPRPEYAETVVANINYELGCNPANVSYLTGLGQKRPREIVHQYAQSDRRVLPPSGIPLGSVQADFDYVGHYKTELRLTSYPPDDAATAPYPIYDRWSDAYNVQTEFVISNQGRSLGSLAFWAAQTPAKSVPWKSATARIVLPTKMAALHKPIIARLESELDLSAARIVWEGRDQEPAIGPSFTFVGKSAGEQWIEAETHLPDGRRMFAAAQFSANSPVVFWVNGALPGGAQPLTTGGDTWTWTKPVSKPNELVRSMYAATPQHESNGKTPLHEHGFDHAEETLSVDKGDVLFAFVYIDPENPPREIMLNWNDGTWEHRAYWGTSLIKYGNEGTPGQRNMGPMPKAGGWVRLEVPASAVALEGRAVKGMTFSVHGGRVIWDAAGKMTGATKALGRFPVPTPEPDAE